MSLRLLIADDHTIVRDGLLMRLETEFLKPEIHEAVDGNELLEKINDYQFDLIILDVRMPGSDTLQMIHDIHRHNSNIKVLVFSMYPESIFALRLLRNGASGYLNKTAPKDELVKAVRVIMSGRKYVSSALQEITTELAITGKTENVFDTMMMLVEGLTIRKIADTLHVHSSTAGTYRTRLYEKLGVNNLMELTRLAREYQIL